jgi:hypothetical protein
MIAVFQFGVTIEEQTAKLPSDVFLWAALGSMAASLTLKFTAKKHTALFVGEWAAPFLLLGYIINLSSWKAMTRKLTLKVISIDILLCDR